LYLFILLVVLSLGTGLTGGTPYTFEWTGANMVTPSPWQMISGSFDIEYYSGLQNIRTYSLTTNTPVLSAGGFSGTPTATCTNFYSQYSGTGGNVECTLNIPLISTTYTNIHSIRLNFLSTGFSIFYPFCEAYVNSGATTTNYGQLSCSRIDTGSSSGNIRISGFTFATNSVISVVFRARAKLLDTLPVEISLELQKAGVYYTVHETSTPFSIDLANGLVTTSKINFFPFLK